MPVNRNGVALLRPYQKIGRDVYVPTCRTQDSIHICRNRKVPR